MLLSGLTRNMTLLAVFLSLTFCDVAAKQEFKGNLLSVDLRLGSWNEVCIL